MRYLVQKNMFNKDKGEGAAAGGDPPTEENKGAEGTPDDTPPTTAPGEGEGSKADPTGDGEESTEKKEEVDEEQQKRDDKEEAHKQREREAVRLEKKIKSAGEDIERWEARIAVLAKGGDDAKEEAEPGARGEAVGGHKIGRCAA